MLFSFNPEFPLPALCRPRRIANRNRRNYEAFTKNGSSLFAPAVLAKLLGSEGIA